MAKSRAPLALEAGRLLVANPALPDPNFERTVVLLLAYSAEGAVGVVLNRPTETDLGEPLPGWQRLAADPAVLFIGGPVQQEAVICLARERGPEGESWRTLSAEDLQSVGSEPLGASVPLEGLDAPWAGVTAGRSQVRVFSGYAGWGPGQLDDEVAAGAWWVLEAQPDDPFCSDPERLWKAVLRRQGGELALVSAYPRDPRWN